MIANIVAVAVQRPGQIFFKAVRVSVVGDHLQMFLDRLHDLRCVCDCRNERPNDKSNAQQGRECPPSNC